MQLPIFLHQRNVPLPESGDAPARCVVAENGIFLERRSAMFSTSIRVNSHELGLARYEEHCRLMCGKISQVLHGTMLGFFKCAHALHGGEAALVLLYHPQRKSFRWLCPRQVVDMYPTRSGWTAGDLIEYQIPLALPDGCVNFGDAHLHIGPPTPSLVDVCDDQDGLHIIVGTIQSSPTYHVTFVMDGARFQFQPDAVFEDPHCRPFERTSSRWLRQIQVRWPGNGSAPTHPPANTQQFGTPTS